MNSRLKGLTSTASVLVALGVVLPGPGAGPGSRDLIEIAEQGDSWWCKIVSCGRTDVPGGVQAKPDAESDGASRGLSSDVPGEPVGSGAPPTAAKPAEPAPPPSPEKSPQ